MREYELPKEIKHNLREIMMDVIRVGHSGVESVESIQELIKNNLNIAIKKYKEIPPTVFFSIGPIGELNCFIDDEPILE